jgi:prepilin-type N-terminal cleavage/methylation domain-containing protein
MMQNSRRVTKGFTLIETVITLSIIGILAMVVAPNITNSLHELYLNNAVQKLKADIRYARELALSRHGRYGIEIDQANNRYQIYELVGASKIAVTDTHTGASMTIDFDQLAAFNGVTIADSSTTDVTINAFGVPFDENNLALGSPATITLQNGGLTKMVQIRNETGYVDTL